MRILITGVGGFVGTHLVDAVRRATPDAEIHGIYIEDVENPPVIPHVLDLRDQQAVLRVMDAVQPNQIYHLAGQASVRLSFDAPWDTFDHNVRPQLNMSLAMIDLGIAPRVLVISSGEIYNAEQDTPCDEESPIAPSNPYGVSKVTQEMLAIQYHRSHKLPFLRVRPFNHFGPGQRPIFVVPDFASQIAAIEAGKQEPMIRVGNLSAQRDFTDVRDVVRAYVLVMAHGEPGAVYNVASGKAVSIQSLLETLVSLSTVHVNIEVEPERFRPNSQPRTWGNASRLQQITGWQPEYSLEQTLKDVLDECRARVEAERIKDAESR